MDLIASSAVNLPITSASLGLVVVRIGIRSSHCTYLIAPVLPLVTFTTNLVGFMFSFAGMKTDARINALSLKEKHQMG
jgi:hypothetical protein